MEGTTKMAQSNAKAILKTERGGIVVLDFGGQYTQLIARRVREQQGFSAVMPCTASAEDHKRKMYAVQFHPEVNHTDRGTEILRNFLFRVCKAEPKWSGKAFIEETVEAIREKVGAHHAICGLSGGVDSTVAAALVHRAMGERLTNIFVNTGMLRENEFEHTLEMYRERLGLRVIGVDASEEFLGKVEGGEGPG